MKDPERISYTLEGEPVGLPSGVRIKKGSPGRTLFADRGRGAMYAQNGKLLELGRLMMRGLSIRESARRAGVSRTTARKLYRILLAARTQRGDGDILCACGLPSVHQGWCTERFRRSDKRQSFMGRWHARKVA